MGGHLAAHAYADCRLWPASPTTTRTSTLTVPNICSIKNRLVGIRAHELWLVGCACLVRER